MVGLKQISREQSAGDAPASPAQPAPKVVGRDGRQYPARRPTAVPSASSPDRTAAGTVGSGGFSVVNVLLRARLICSDYTAEVGRRIRMPAPPARGLVLLNALTSSEDDEPHESECEEVWYDVKTGGYEAYLGEFDHRLTHGRDDLLADELRAPFIGWQPLEEPRPTTLPRQ
jgi:hypothetical protein